MVATVTQPASFTIGSVDQQKIVCGHAFPLVLNPSLTGSLLHTALKDSHSWLEEKLLQHGALLLRGFDVPTAAEFNAAVEACGWPELPYVGGAAPRTNVVGRVFTSNESPPDQKIPFHHEMAQVPEFPSKILFFCEVKPGKGGETPILYSHSIYLRMRATYPDFVDKLEKHGLLYIRVMSEIDDPSSPIGRGWQSTFQTKDKTEAEKKAAKLGMKLEWLSNGDVKTVSGPLPAIKWDERRGQKVWFNSMVAAYTGWEDVRNDSKKAVVFGDGSPLPEEAMEGCLAILTEESVAIPWEQGDIYILDNIAVQHARTSFEPPRRILASLCR